MIHVSSNHDSSLRMLGSDFENAPPTPSVNTGAPKRSFKIPDDIVSPPATPTATKPNAYTRSHLGPEETMSLRDKQALYSIYSYAKSEILDYLSEEWAKLPKTEDSATETARSEEREASLDFLRLSCQSILQAIENGAAKFHEPPQESDEVSSSPTRPVERMAVRVFSAHLPPGQEAQILKQWAELSTELKGYTPCKLSKASIRSLTWTLHCLIDQYDRSTPATRHMITDLNKCIERRICGPPALLEALDSLCKEMRGMSDDFHEREGTSKGTSEGNTDVDALSRPRRDALNWGSDKLADISRELTKSRSASNFEQKLDLWDRAASTIFRSGWLDKESRLKGPAQRVLDSLPIDLTGPKKSAQLLRATQAQTTE